MKQKDLKIGSIYIIDYGRYNFICQFREIISTRGVIEYMFNIISQSQESNWPYTYFKLRSGSEVFDKLTWLSD